MNKWSEKLNIPLPECNKCGCCCKCASPSASYLKLLEKAANGEDFARDFLSIFVPYNNIEEAKVLYPDIVERSVKAIKKSTNNDDFIEPVFYKCRYVSDENTCGIYEDRPELCREFPGIPQVIVAKQCAFYDWTIECRKKLEELKTELEVLKNMKKELDNIKYRQKAVNTNYLLKRIPHEYKFMVLCPSLSLVSPKNSIY